MVVTAPTRAAGFTTTEVGHWATARGFRHTCGASPTAVIDADADKEPDAPMKSTTKSGDCPVIDVVSDVSDREAPCVTVRLVHPSMGAPLESRTVSFADV